MKTIIILLLSYFIVSNNGYAQSTSKSSYPVASSLPNSGQSNVYQKNIARHYNAHPINSDTLYKADQKSENDQQSTIYMDTRLGSSSKMYDTYEKNDYGAGAITTNPNK